MCAFGHSDGGTVFFGVKEDIEVVGAQLGMNALENLANNIRANTDHSLTPAVEQRKSHGKVVLAVTVQKARADQLNYAYNTTYIRVGKTNQVLSPDQQRAPLQTASWEQIAALRQTPDMEVGWGRNQRSGAVADTQRVTLTIKSGTDHRELPLVIALSNSGERLASVYEVAFHIP